MSTRSPNARSRHRRWLSALLALAGIGLAGFLIYRSISRYSPDQLAAAVLAVPTSRIAMCTLFAALSYICLTGFDWLATRHVGHKLPYRYVALTSFCSLSLGHNIGFAALSSGAVRYRFYSRAGIPFADIAVIIVFCGVTVVLGLLTLGGIALLVSPEQGEALTGLPRTVLLPLGVLCLLVPAAYVLLAALVRHPIPLRHWQLHVPRPWIASAQVAIGCLNFACVAASLFQAISAVAEVRYLLVAAVYVVANVLSLIAHAPGGLGVIEAVVLHLISQDKVIGALIIFRVTYFFIPLALGLALFAANELMLRFRRGRSAALPFSPKP